MSFDIKSLVLMLGHPSECTPMTSCSSCCYLVLTLYPFVFNLKALVTNTQRIQVLQDAFVLTLQGYFSFFQ
jgi:hypothetical protein